MTYIIQIFSFIFGTILGSFFSVITHRLHHKLNGTWLGRSICPKCNSLLKPIELIPILSYLMQRGKCKNCFTKISSRYPIIELTTGLIFSLIGTQFLIFNFQLLTFTFYILYSALLILIAIYDIEHQEIPMQFSIPLGLLSLLGGIFLFNQSAIYLILGGLVGFLFFYLQHLISSGKWVGLGDADLALAMGLLLGPSKIGLTIFSAYLLGSILGIYLLITKKADSKSQLPLGPFLVIGFYITIFYGNNLISLILNQ